MTIRALGFFVGIFMVVCAMAQPVKVMTYNIRYDTPKDSVNQWGKRTAKVFALIKKYDPDIFGVQEAVNNQVTDLAGNLPGYAYIGVGRDDGKTKGEYSAIFYKKDRFTVLDQNTFWLSKNPSVPGSKDWDAAITRVASWGKLMDKKSRKEFLMINTHFDHVGQESRKNSAALLKQKAAELGNGLPVLLTGDFNCTREDVPYATIMDPTGVILKDPAPANPPGTFCSFNVNSIQCRPIDYIFYTPEWTASNYAVITDNDGKYYPSDHLPVVTTFQLKK